MDAVTPAAAAAAAGTELVGPLPTVRFWDGSRVVYQPPSNTLDPRYAACSDHRVGCDCREAMHAEDIAEFRAELRHIRAAVADVLAGHATYAYTDAGEIDYARRCPCTGCQIARLTHGVRDFIDQHREGTPDRRPPGWTAPR